MALISISIIVISVIVPAPSLAVAADGEVSAVAASWPWIAIFTAVGAAVAAAVAAALAAIHCRRRWAEARDRLTELRSSTARQSDLLGAAPVEFIS